MYPHVVMAKMNYTAYIVDRPDGVRVQEAIKAICVTQAYNLTPEANKQGVVQQWVVSILQPMAATAGLPRYM